MYVAVHVTDSPGASVVTGHDTGPTFGSVTATVDESPRCSMVGDHEAVRDRVTGVDAPAGVGVHRRGGRLVQGEDGQELIGEVVGGSTPSTVTLEGPLVNWPAIPVTFTVAVHEA